MVTSIHQFMGGEHLMTTKDFYTISKNRDYWVKLYLDYVNNYLSVERFAEYWSLSNYQANKLINYFRNDKRLHDRELIVS